MTTISPQAFELAMVPGCVPKRANLSLAETHLSFSVSYDEEFVKLHLVTKDLVIDLGERSHNYFLLTLARRRLRDASAGFVESACGWIHYDEITHDPTMSRAQINLATFRARRLLTRYGVVDVETIVQRRLRAGQIRIGTGDISISRV